MCMFVFVYWCVFVWFVVCVFWSLFVVRVCVGVNVFVCLYVWYIYIYVLEFVIVCAFVVCAFIYICSNCCVRLLCFSVHVFVWVCVCVIMLGRIVFMFGANTFIYWFRFVVVGVVVGLFYFRLSFSNVCFLCVCVVLCVFFVFCFFCLCVFGMYVQSICFLFCLGMVHFHLHL